MTSKSIETGFPPVLGTEPKVLILGTMPSVKSLEEQQYYGHPRNSFWWIMSQICGFALDIPYEERLALSVASGIAIWDVAYSCHRPGSLDSSIDQSTVEANDITGLLEQNPSIGLIVFNGQAAEKLFKKFVGSQHFLGHTICLPSTSPANAGMTKEDKLLQWASIKNYM